MAMGLSFQADPLIQHCNVEVQTSDPNQVPHYTYLPGNVIYLDMQC